MHLGIGDLVTELMLALNVSGCLFLYVSSAMSWLLVQEVTRLLPEDRCDQFPVTLLKGKAVGGWMGG